MAYIGLTELRLAGRDSNLPPIAAQKRGWEKLVYRIDRVPLGQLMRLTEGVPVVLPRK